LFRKDVFISHSVKDTEWVEELARDLERAGVSVFLDKWDLLPGQPWLRGLENALRNSSAGIVVLSPDSVESGAVQAEMTVLLERHWSDRRPFVPVLYRSCRIPEIVRTIQYVDFESQERAQALETLVRSIKRSRSGLLRRLSPQPKASLSYTVLSAIVVPSLLLAGIGVTGGVRGWLTKDELHLVQAGIEEIDAKIKADEKPGNTVFYNGELVYRDPQTGKMIASDRWNFGTLMWRNFFRNGQLVARDEFRYPGNHEVVEKTRSYLNAQRQVFLIDRFAQDGELVEKRNCPQGPEEPCRPLLDVMRSPLPPSVLPFYR
jgi:hypothetical protein